MRILVKQTMPETQARRTSGPRNQDTLPLLTKLNQKWTW